ncbi:hypothetical protein MNEG_5402 [Monoraphidium neglectum]|uniref:Uncharacterized protein n=1 Tax=Monoraphidium neglectum TaxID=145388 RepID=A0A0D2NAH1_9CHLO|nr:hypothetical protein MNEG_5402 [Monoraphidium neglectum]KIZ02561.1 hypothetical protein MNEG_5402 [Monoraphidium neglectum]|eukprot:XP_013901580.1 hypothetical protein MNEG_5402 [Monoraphidium neglectum]
MTPSSGARWSRPAPALVLALALALAAQHCSTVRAAPAWIPDMTMKFEYQLSKVFDVAKDFDPNVQVYLLDCSDTPADAVAAIRAQGAHPIGYFRQAAARARAGPCFSA